MKSTASAIDQASGKAWQGLALMSVETCVVYPRCPFVVVLSRLWICDYCTLLNSSSCASLEVDAGVCHDLAAARVARECRPHRYM